MTLRALAAAVCCAAAPALGGVTDAPPPEPPRPIEPPPRTTATGERFDETTLKAHRTPFDVLSDRMIGLASRALRYDWRKATVQVVVTSGTSIELNNFNDARLGGAVRVPMAGLLVELGVHYVWSWGSDSSDKLSLTPYRQAGRPSRVEADLGLGYPLFEGVTTPRWGFIPPVELVLMVNAGLRARWYPHELDQMQGGPALSAFFSPKLNDQQVDNLEYARPAGMEVDRNRYDLLVGFSLALYFHNGALLSPRLTFAPPVFAASTRSTLQFWWDLSLALGWSF